MKHLAVIAFVALAFGHIADAAPRSILVLKTEGSADAAIRTSLDGSILKLAKNLDGKVEGGDITLSDAAAAVGCNPADASCKDDVLATLGVDEVIATTATSTPTGTNVTVRRLSKGTAPRAAQAALPPGKPSDAKITADLGPLFGVGLSTAPISKTEPAKTEPAKTEPAKTEPAKTEPAKTEPAKTEPARTQPTNTANLDNSPVPGRTQPGPTTAQVDQTPINDNVTAAPNGQVAPTTEGPQPSYRWQKIGMAAGGALVVLSFVMWAKASDTQSQIDSQPANTPADFVKLRQLETDADGYAGGGNLFFIGGIIVGGISGYSYWKGHRAHTSQQASVAPAVFPHGAGVTLTFGGAQ